MNNGCSHELKARQIRRHNVNKEFLLAYLSGRRWAKLTHRKPVKQTVMGESICWLYINTSVMSNRVRQADREREKEGDSEREPQESVNVFTTKVHKGQKK